MDIQQVRAVDETGSVLSIQVGGGEGAQLSVLELRKDSNVVPYGRGL